MPIYKSRWFAKWAKKEKLSDDALCKAVAEMIAGLIDADLGQGVLKKRVAKQGKGKSGGYRTLIITNRGDRWIFVYGLLKNERGNFTITEEKAWKRLAGILLAYPVNDFNRTIVENGFIEVHCDEEN